jgi:hypothetical protein
MKACGGENDGGEYAWWSRGDLFAGVGCKFEDHEAAYETDESNKMEGQAPSIQQAEAEVTHVGSKETPKHATCSRDTASRRAYMRH